MLLFAAVSDAVGEWLDAEVGGGCKCGTKGAAGAEGWNGEEVSPKVECGTELLAAQRVVT
jgi:hypothetical protein